MEYYKVGLKKRAEWAIASGAQVVTKKRLCQLYAHLGEIHGTL